MPKRKRTSKNGKKRSKRRTTRYIGPSNSVSLSVIRNPNNTVLPQTLVTKLRYSTGTAIGLNPSFGAPTSVYYFRCCSAYDPDATGVGHQPMGYDQLTAMYQKYTVLKSKIYVLFSQNADTFCNQTVYLRRVTSQSTVPQPAILETAHCQYRILGPDGGSKSLKLDYDFKQMFPGASPMDDRYFADVAATPQENVYWEIGSFASNEAVDPPQILATVLIEYEVLFHDPIVLTSS